jgi:hypothetical protein
MAVINGVELDSDENLLDIPESKDLTVPPQVGLAAIALNFAMKYSDIITVQDGALFTSNTSWRAATCSACI